MNLTRKLFDVFSKKAVLKAVREENNFFKIWEWSFRVLPKLDDHFVNSKLTDEALYRIRLLICAEAYFTKKVINSLFKKGEIVKNYLDIGDSDGSARILLSRSMEGFDLDTLGINLQTKAVERIRSKGLAAECVDAMEIHKSGRKYDVVSVFETLEHLPNPIGFLEDMHNMVSKRLIISVPLIISSRVGLEYLDNKWPKDKTPSIENNHVFELTPEDWGKIFLHSGWNIEEQQKVRQFPSRGLLKLLMQYAWRKISFEGYWFVSLKKGNTYRKKFCIE